MDARETVVRYHDATKHFPHRCARSLGYLDWATQPDPFRRYDGAPLIQLPVVADDASPPYDDLYQRGRVPPVPVTAHAVSRFFECSLAISAWKQAGGSRWALRCNPSSGNLHPTEGYLVIGATPEIGDRPGVYHYAPQAHGLELRKAFEPALWDALMTPFPPDAFLVGLSSIHWREAWKYGERAFRYCQHDVGHALGACRIAAAALGWRLVLLEDLGDAEVSRLLGLDRNADFEDAEAEHPDLVAVVFPDRRAETLQRHLEDEAVFRIVAGSWMGKAGRLSRDHVDWEIIDEVARATHKPHVPVARDPSAEPPAAAAASYEPTSPSRSGQPLSARRVIRQRRSAVAMDGVTSIAAETFFRMLARVVPNGDAAPPPWDCCSWPPEIHLLMFVHRVAGIPAGLYALVRNRVHLDRLQTATRDDFLWHTPPRRPVPLPLYLLREVDCRQAAASLSLGQDIAGDGAFSLGMISDFEAALAEHGPWFYRRLFWEAGMIGQVLYLEAEAAGVRATGIGAYFDDPVHEIFGLSGHAFQSMYHFTVGGPVDDPRISTLPAYPWSRDQNL